MLRTMLRRYWLACRLTPALLIALAAGASSGCDSDSKGGGGADDEATQGTDEGDASDGATSSTDSGSGSEDDGDRPSPYAEEGGDDEGETPVMSSEESAAAAVAGLRTFVTLRPDDVLELYESLFVPEPGCPEEILDLSEGPLQGALWASAGCTTSAGTQFAGSGRFTRGYVDPGGGGMGEGATLSAEGGQFSIVAADGRSIQFSGYMGYQRNASAESTEGYMYIDAQISADAESAATSPLLDGSTRPRGEMFSYAANGIKIMGGQGALTGDGLDDAVAMSFSDVVMINLGCTAEPGGTLSVRDSAGFWHDVVFDAYVRDAEGEGDFDLALCDGCGSYVAGGRIGDDVCLESGSLGGLFEWEDHAW